MVGHRKMMLCKMGRIYAGFVGFAVFILSLGFFIFILLHFSLLLVLLPGL